jgi:hypothetical protein
MDTVKNLEPSRNTRTAPAEEVMGLVSRDPAFKLLLLKSNFKMTIPFRERDHWQSKGTDGAFMLCKQRQKPMAQSSEFAPHLSSDV